MDEHLYFIALAATGDLAEKIRLIRVHCSEKYRSKKALRSPPHITLIPPFKQEASIEAVIEKKLTPFFRKYSPFVIDLNGFGRFDNRVIFIKPEKNPYLQKLEEELRNFLSEEFSFIEPKPARAFNPHVTIASGDLSKKNFHPAWQEFENMTFHEMWSVSSAHLLKHDGKKWNPVIEFKIGSE